MDTFVTITPGTSALRPSAPPDSMENIPNELHHVTIILFVSVGVVMLMLSVFGVVKCIRIYNERKLMRGGGDNLIDGNERGSRSKLRKTDKSEQGSNIIVDELQALKKNRHSQKTKLKKAKHFSSTGSINLNGNIFPVRDGLVRLQDSYNAKHRRHLHQNLFPYAMEEPDIERLFESDSTLTLHAHGQTNTASEQATISNTNKQNVDNLGIENDYVNFPIQTESPPGRLAIVYSTIPRTRSKEIGLGRSRSKDNMMQSNANTKVIKPLSLDKSPVIQYVNEKRKERFNIKIPVDISSDSSINKTSGSFLGLSKPQTPKSVTFSDYDELHVISPSNSIPSILSSDSGSFSTGTPSDSGFNMYGTVSNLTLLVDEAVIQPTKDIARVITTISNSDGSLSTGSSKLVQGSHADSIYDSSDFYKSKYVRGDMEFDYAGTDFLLQMHHHDNLSDQRRNSL